MPRPDSIATRGTGEPRLASVASWAVLVASFGLSASTWIALARLAGFTDTLTVPLLDVRLAMAWLMPIAVDGYVTVALVLWMAPVPAKVAAFARKNTYGAAGVGIAAQSAYHLLFTLSTTDEAWRVALAAIVGALPPAVAGLAVHMRSLIRRESSRSNAAPAAPATVPMPTAVTSNAPVNRPIDKPSTVATTAVPSLDARPAPNIGPSTTDNGTTAPAQSPDQVVPEVPTPAAVAARINPPRPTSTPTEKPAARAAAPTTRRPRPTSPTTPAPKLAPSPTDTPVTAPDAAQLTLPIVAPELLARAAQVARQYRTEHGTPITPGQLAVRLKVTSEQATQALAVLDLDPNHSNRPTMTVNGRSRGATR
jgi:hypothetical protein